jgi:hypothetical protein
VDIEDVVECCALDVPSLRDLARRFYKAEPRHLDIPLDPLSVAVRRAEGEPPVNITATADELTKHHATEADPLADGSALMVVARAGAQTLISGIESDGSAEAQRFG